MVGHRGQWAGEGRRGRGKRLWAVQATASELGRGDLAAAAAWLADHRPTEEAEVVCHGDMHPFNALIDDVGTVTVLDWSAAQLAPATLARFVPAKSSPCAVVARSAVSVRPSRLATPGAAIGWTCGRVARTPLCSTSGGMVGPGAPGSVRAGR